MISIDPFNKDRYDEVRAAWDRVAKPLGSLGRFEDITARIGAIHDSTVIDIKKRAVIMMIADNGIVAEGVTQSGQDVTAAVAEWMGRGESSVCKMAKTAKADTIPVDVGINMEGSPKGVVDRKVMKGTRNFAYEPAMTEDECMQAIEAGIDIVCDCSAKGYKLLATGEMGIGNTTTSSALAAALLGLDAGAVTGRGAGLSTAGLRRKIQVIQDVLDRYCTEDEGGRDSSEFAMHMLSCVGGLDIAGLTGVFLGGAMNRIPVIIDGFISAVAALVAERLVPGTKDYMIASHQGKEPGMKYILDILGLEPVINGMLALGEGTGAVMLMPLLDTALALYSDGLAFADTTVEQYTDFEAGPEGSQTVLIIGYPDSGKSAIAEKMVTEMSDPDCRLYVATMIPYGQEGRDRVEKHRRMRAGKGFIIGDMTGIGKGRQGAALIRWAINQGKTPIYFTQKAKLFTDNYRDMCDIGSKGLRPFIMSSNDEAPITEIVVDKNGEVVYDDNGKVKTRVVYGIPTKQESERVYCLSE